VVSHAIEFVYRFSGQETPLARRQAARKAAKKVTKKIR
jgi:hypothetical protein